MAIKVGTVTKLLGVLVMARLFQGYVFGPRRAQGAAGDGASTQGAPPPQMAALIDELQGSLEQRLARSTELKGQLATTGGRAFSSVPAAAPLLAGGGRQCQRQAMFHGHTTMEMNTTYRKGGVVSWVLVDAFVMRTGNPCGWKTPCHGKLPVVAIELMARIYQNAPWNMVKRLAKRRRWADYTRMAHNRSVTWQCNFATGETTQVLGTVLDGDKHTLILRCPLPAAALVGGTDATGRLKVAVELTAVDPSPLLIYTGINACDRELVPADTHMGACVMFQEMSPLNTADTAAMWSRFMLDAGFTFLALYLDPMGNAEELEAQVHAALAPEIAAGKVATVLFHMNDRYSLQTQSAQQNHCQWRFRGRAKWVAHLDLDEFVQPLAGFTSLAQVLAQYDDDDKVAALQVRNRFWDHHPLKNHSLTAFDAWNLVWRDARPTVTGREKIISKSELVDYISVHKVRGAHCCGASGGARARLWFEPHRSPLSLCEPVSRRHTDIAEVPRASLPLQVTTGGRSKVPDPEKELRHNHYSRHFKGFDEGVHCGSSFRAGNCNDAMKAPIEDLSFQEYYLRISQHRGHLPTGTS